MPENERTDSLLWRQLSLIQQKDTFALSLDGVLLANFVTIKNKDTVVDLGTGNGALPLLLWCRAPEASFTGLEIQPDIADLAQRNVSGNGLAEKIAIVTGDMKEASALLGRGHFSLVVSNPPYGLADAGRISPKPAMAAAKSEIFCKLSDVVREGAALLNSGGRLALVHRPTRLAEICVFMEEYGVVPKRLKLVQPVPDKPPNLVLIEGIRGGRPGLHVEPTLMVYEKPGLYSKAMKEIFAGRTGGNTGNNR